MPVDKRNAEGEQRIAGDRRQDRRYALQLDCRWKLIRRRRVLDSGTGNTIDLSSGGLQFDAGRHLPEGLNVELSINWPVLLHNVAPMQLVVSGRIVRARGRMIAVRSVQHEFRTVGVPTEQLNSLSSGSRGPTVLANQAIFASLGKMQ
jgi:hypothetical protein